MRTAQDLRANYGRGIIKFTSFTNGKRCRHLAAVTNVSYEMRESTIYSARPVTGGGALQHFNVPTPTLVRINVYERLKKLEYGDIEIRNIKFTDFDDSISKHLKKVKGWTISNFFVSHTYDNNSSNVSYELVGYIPVPKLKKARVKKPKRYWKLSPAQYRKAKNWYNSNPTLDEDDLAEFGVEQCTRMTDDYLDCIEYVWLRDGRIALICTTANSDIIKKNNWRIIRFEDYA